MLCGSTSNRLKESLVRQYFHYHNRAPVFMVGRFNLNPLLVMFVAHFPPMAGQTGGAWQAHVHDDGKLRLFVSGEKLRVLRISHRKRAHVYHLTQSCSVTIESSANFHPVES